MRIALPFICLVFFISCDSGWSQENSGSYDSLRAGFVNPVGTARPKVYWWWLNGYTDTTRLKEELQAIKDAGLGGMDIFEIGVPPANNPNHMVKAGPSFMSEESLEAIKLALDEAARLDLEVGLNLASSWNAGGNWVEPKHAAKTVYFSTVTIEGGKHQKVNLPFPKITPDKSGKSRKIEYASDGKPEYYEEIAVLAVPSGEANLVDTSRIMHITKFFNPENQVLAWKAPEGQWDIYRLICSNSGEQLLRPSENSQGPILDHFDSATTRMHLMHFIDRLQPLVGDFKKSALKYFYLASYEAKEFAWTPSFPTEFQKINGYDVYKFLPSLFQPELFDPEVLRKFNHDYAETFSELMINNHYRKAKEICNSYGLQIISESGGPGHMHHIPVETLKALGALDIPRGEFWYERPYYDQDSVDMVWLVKEIAAAAHIYKRDIVEEEAFTSYWDWQESPADLKSYADRAFCEGMNRLVIHGFTHNPTEFGHPGIAYFAGTHFNDKRVWWPKVKPFNDYLARVSYILQQTDFVADVLYYYGEEIPNLVPPKNTRFAVGAGYDYEVINTEVLMNDLTVENGELVLPGVSRYKVLYVDEEEISLETLNKLKELAEQGARIVGKKPTASIGLSQQADADKAVAKSASELWNTSEKDFSENGKIYADISPIEALQSLGIPPDFDYSDHKADQRYAPLDYIHYQVDEKDFYLIRNTTDQWISRLCSFRQQNKKPEIWDPVSGEIYPVSLYKLQAKQVEIPLTLPPYGSYFVVFTNGTTSSHFSEISTSDQHPPRLAYTESGLHFLDKGTYELRNDEGLVSIENNPVVLPLDSAWELSFPEHLGTPATATFPELMSWTEAENKGIRYFSGTATYHKTFNFRNKDQHDKLYLDLGDLAEVAEVWLNDDPLGITWTPPYRFDISDVIREGENTLTVEVANTWSNRLTGDAITGEKFTHTNIVKANKNLVPWEELPLKQSGLLGPVTIQALKLVPNP